MSSLARQIGNELANMVDGARRSLVQIGAGRRRGGAGTIWHSDGLVLSNAHVAEQGPVEITLADGRTLPARLLARDNKLDLAALAVNASELPTIALGESRRLRPGQLVLALGHPWGTVGSATAGVVIGTGAQWPDIPPSKREWIVAGLGLRPGNSGGPLLNAHGQLVGINTMITGPEVGAAVPVHVVKAFLHEGLGSKGAAA